MPASPARPPPPSNPTKAMASLSELFVPFCLEARVDMIVSVPDGYLVPLIEAARDNDQIRHVAAAREEECLGIAAGAVMSGRRALAMMQNAGFLNAIGCFATLCMNYGLPLAVLVSHRGNLFDRNRYDIEKYRFFENFIRHTHVFNLSWHKHRGEGNLIRVAFERAEVAGEPVILCLDMPPSAELEN